MREILFRGKCVDDGEWVYGVPIFRKNICYMVEGLCICDKCYCKQAIYNCVHPESIGQYTGLKDKNGKRIFEGDILKTCADAWEWMNEGSYDIHISVVEFENGCFVLDDTYSSDGYNDLSCVYSEYTRGNGEYENYVIFEVIGNIHDNPELLEVEHDG